MIDLRKSVMSLHKAFETARWEHYGLWDWDVQNQRQKLYLYSFFSLLKYMRDGVFLSPCVQKHWRNWAYMFTFPWQFGWSRTQKKFQNRLLRTTWFRKHAVRGIKLYAPNIFCIKEKLSVLHQTSYQRSRESARPSLPSSELGPSPPTRKWVLPPFYGSKGGDTLAGGEGVGGSNSNEETDTLAAMDTV